MKLFLSLIFVVVVSMWLTLRSEPSLTANDLALGSTNEPIKVLGVKLSANNPQSQKVGWLEGLEVQIQNISGKPIQYLVIHAELPVEIATGERARVPLAYGQVFAESKSDKVEIFQPGAKLTLRASKIDCERVKHLVASGFVPSSKDIQPNLHVVLFADRTSWMSGRLHYPDPVNPNKWIAAEELQRSEARVTEASGVSFLKANSKSSAKSQTCYRYLGFVWEYCCDSPSGNPIYVANQLFAEDPTGTVHPETAMPCCGIDSGCCFNDVLRPGCAP